MESTSTIDINAEPPKIMLSDQPMNDKPPEGEQKKVVTTLMNYRTTAMKYVWIISTFLYMQLLMTITLLLPEVRVDVAWVPKAFFFPNLKIMFFLTMKCQRILVTSTVLSLLGLLSYFQGGGPVTTSDYTIYGRTLNSFRKNMIGIRQKYWWLCMVPWIGFFIHSFCINVGKFMFFCSQYGALANSVDNFYLIVVLMILLFLTQLTLASEMFAIAYSGYVKAHIINDQNVKWIKLQRFFRGLIKKSRD